MTGVRQLSRDGHGKGCKLTVAVDTSDAGVNQTGVGKYSRRLAERVEALSAELGIRSRCYGPSCPPKNGRQGPGRLYQGWPTYTQLYLPLALAALKPDIVHSTSQIGPLWGYGSKIVTVHDLIFLRSPQDYAPHWLAMTRATLPLVLRRAAGIIADSHTTRLDLERIYRETRGKVWVVYPGIDEGFRARISPSANRRARHNYGLADDRYILCLGPWVRRKRLEVVVQAFSRLAEDIGDVQLVLTGRSAPGMDKGSTSEVLGALPTHSRERVTTAGHVEAEDLPALLAGAALLAYPSEFEGFGLPPLEAMAAGTPVAVRRTPALTEACGDAALEVDSDDPGDWAAAMRSILEGTELAGRLREAGRRRSAQFTWDRCARETINVYKDVARRTLRPHHTAISRYREVGRRGATSSGSKTQTHGEDKFVNFI